MQIEENFHLFVYVTVFILGVNLGNPVATNLSSLPDWIHNHG